jgi:hypothetical protein
VVAPDGASLIYGSPELRIPAFVARGDPAAAAAADPADPAIRG